MNDQKKTLLTKGAVPQKDFSEEKRSKQFRIIDVSSERKKPVFMGVEEFAEKLRKFSCIDYFKSDEPYYMLVEASRGQVGLFDQCAEVLKAAAHTNEKLDSSIEEKIESFKWTFIECLGEVSSILDFIGRVEQDPETADKVSVLPLMCGSGKSTAITKKIIDVIKQGNGAGMLLVTDSTKRLEGIWNSNTDNPLLTDEEIGFIKEHKKDVAILTAETYAESISRQRSCPVLAMTTQRFFYVLTKEEIRGFLEWEKNGERHERPLIIFDEEPFLNEINDITPKTVNDISSMLYMVLDDDPTKQTDKAWCISQWELFRERFLDKLWQYEHSPDGRMFYHEELEHCLTEDDERFFRIIMDNRTKIRSDSTEVFKSLWTMKAFVDTWGIYTHRSDVEYESKFTVYVDNSDKVKDLGAKVIVLDGTGDISPTYAGLDYIDMRNGESFVRSLSHLIIRLGDINTGKTRLGDNKSFVPKAIMSYLNSLGYTKDNTTIFTYKQHEAKFNKSFRKRTEHFGNIKGSNKYADDKCIAQVGLNQMQPVHYLCYMLARHDDIRLRLVGLSLKDSDMQIKQILKETNNCSEIMINHVLADIDQNMFRTAIRSAKNRQDVVYYLFYKDESLPELKTTLKHRYKDKLGASIEYIDEDTITIAEKEKDSRIAAKIFKWYYKWNGSPIKREDVLHQLGDMIPDTFKKTIKRNKELNALFTTASENAKKAGKMRGWYSK